MRKSLAQLLFTGSVGKWKLPADDSSLLKFDSKNFYDSVWQNDALTGIGPYAACKYS